MTNSIPHIITSPQVLAKDLVRYRFFAWITGVMLLLLTANMVYKYAYIPFCTPGVHVPHWTNFIPIVHGWCYALYLIFCAILSIHMRWPVTKTVITLLAGTIPFLSFVAEHYRTKEVKSTIENLELNLRN